MTDLANLVPATSESIDFVTRMNPNGPWDLVALADDGRPTAKTFNAGEIERMTAWIDSRQGKESVYFHVNLLYPDRRDIKAKKADIAAGRFLHVDVDELDARDKVLAFEPRPTVTVFTGGGYQAFWRLAEPTTDLDRVERINAAIAKALGGDKCHNIDRIMRVPGTINMPNAKKRAAGRVPVLAAVIEADWTRVYSLDAFPEDPIYTPKAGGKPSNAVAAAVTPINLDQLPAGVGKPARALLELGDDPERPRGTETARYPSRSEAVFHAACLLVKAGCADEVIAGALINPALGISTSILEKSNPAAYALKQARAARNAVADGWPDPDKHGNPRPTMRNAVVAARRLDLKFGYNLFRYRKTIGGNELEEHQGEISDDAVMALRGLIIDRFDFDPRSENVRDLQPAVP